MNIENDAADPAQDDLPEIQEEEGQPPELDENGEPVVAEDDEDDVEFDGKTFRAPKAVKEALAKAAEVAAREAEIEQVRTTLEQETQREREALAQRAQMQQQFAKDFATCHALDRQIAEWRAYVPETDQERWERQEALERLTYERQTAGQALSAKITQTQQQETLAAQQADAKALADLHAALPKVIPGWKPEMEQKVAAFARDVGFPDHEIAAIRDPRIVRVLHLAMQGEQNLKTQQQRTNVQKAQATTPVPQVKGKTAPPAALDDRQSTEAWVRAREAQLRKRG